MQIPNTQAVARRLAEEFSSPGLQQKLIDYAANCVQPSYNYFENTDFLTIVNAFKAAQLFNPERLESKCYNSGRIQKCFPF